MKPEHSDILYSGVHLLFVCVSRTVELLTKELFSGKKFLLKPRNTEHSFLLDILDLAPYQKLYDL